MAGRKEPNPPPGETGSDIKKPPPSPAPPPAPDSRRGSIESQKFEISDLKDYKRVKIYAEPPNEAFVLVRINKSSKRAP